MTQTRPRQPIDLQHMRRCCVALLITCAVALTGCPGVSVDAVSVFETAPVVTIGSAESTTVSNLGALGRLEQDDTLSITVTGTGARTALIVLLDETTGDTGTIVGGAPTDAPFTFFAREPGHYFLFVLYEAEALDENQSVSVTTESIDVAPSAPLDRQLVWIEFEDGFLTEPGLWDPVDGTTEDLAFLTSIESSVRSEIIRSLQQVFENSPIEVIDTPPDDPAQVYSRLTFSPERVLGDESTVNDAFLPPPDPTRPECQVRVIFGEVLPRGTDVDPGNRVHNDEAVVYVGSFQGRGQSCWTSAVNSLNNVVLTLSQTAAHEIGHLVGLYHVEQIDIMNRTATLAFLRNLEFARGQIQVDRIIGGEIVSEVFPPIIQDPDRYFDFVFAADNSEP